MAATPFFDEILELYIHTAPLTVSSQVLNAAESIGAKLEWDSEGNICGVSHDLAVSLCRQLGITMLTVKEFMHLALRQPAVASSSFGEWLIDSYILDTFDRILDGKGQVKQLPLGRPGWFNLAEIDSRGLPAKVSQHNSPGNWKYWSPNPEEPGTRVGALRSWVTSAGACSLDLGIPVQARHPKIMIRECYKTSKPETTFPMDSIWTRYMALIKMGDDAETEHFIISQNVGNIPPGMNSNALLNHKEQEMKFDLIGKKKILMGDSANLCMLGISNLRSTLSISPDIHTTYIVGHPHPDADSAISSIFEALRRNQAYPEKTFLPWMERIPPEVQGILGPELSALVSKIPKFKAYNDVILVDSHKFDEGPISQVKGVIDHHIVEASFPSYVALSHENSWSSTIQVYIKLLGCGFDLDSEIAVMLAEGTILEAEPVLIKRRPALDTLALSRLIGKCRSPLRSYGDLLSILMSEEDHPDFFYKDYRRTRFGFAVVHCREYRDFTNAAKQNNKADHLPLTVIKQVLACDHPPWISSERITLVFNDDFYDKGFRRAACLVVKEACQAFHGKEFLGTDCTLELPEITTQTPRPWLTPHLEKIVQEHLKFHYSKSIERFVSAGFYSGSFSLYGICQTPLCGLSFEDVKKLLHCSANTSFMSLQQYWEVYQELSELNDTHFLERLRDKEYVELLDTVIRNQNEVNGRQVSIAPAIPGLIMPGRGDMQTGIPTNTLSPNNYEDKSLWRYWSPDGDENIATRGHIFLLNRTSIDLKITPQDRTCRLTFRPIYNEIPDLRFSFEYDSTSKGFEVHIIPRLFSIFEDVENEVGDSCTREKRNVDMIEQEELTNHLD